MVIIQKDIELLNQVRWRKLAHVSAQFFDTVEGLSTLKHSSRLWD
jgi:ATP-binding cassette subfamily C protein CydD